MSEYQYYDFRAIDLPLTKQEMAELRSISTRAVITSTSFTNHYEWGSLKANPLRLLEKYFDAFLYVANWGTREFFIRLPEESFDYKTLESMLAGEAVHVQKTGKHLILGFTSELELDDWDDGTGWMGSLMSLRSELLRGDLRCLYLGWLLCVQCEEFADDDLEPPVPAGLSQLSAPLHSLIEFLEIDEDLIELAALNSPPLKAEPEQEELAAWIRRLPEEQKNNLLIAGMCESSERWKIGLWRQFQEETGIKSSSAVDAQRRTVGELMQMARARCQDRTEKLERQGAAEEAKRKAEEETKRAQYLDRLEKNTDKTWDEISLLIQKRQPKPYDEAVTLLSDLHDLAVRKGRLNAFQKSLDELRQKNSGKPSFLDRLARAKL